MKQNAKKSKRAAAKAFKIIVEKYADGYAAYPLGLEGVVVGEADTYEEAMDDVKSAIRFHIEMFGNAVVEVESSVLEAFVTQVGVECTLAENGGKQRRSEMDLTLEEIRTKGLLALRKELGQAGMIRFMQIYSNGSGDYAKERHAWVDNTSMEEIIAQTSLGKKKKK